MTRTPFALLAGGAFMAAAAMFNPQAIAQTDPHQPANDGSVEASMTVPPGTVAPGVDPGTASANSNVRDRIVATHAVNAASQAQYRQDMASYDAAMQAHGHQIARQDAHYAHQQRAYADAMAAWREQAYACKHGSSRACNAPTPDPVDFY